MTEPVAIARDSLGLIAGVRKHLAEIGMTYATLDAIAGWTEGYSSKTLPAEPADNQVRARRSSKRWLGRQAFDELLAASGIVIWIVRDDKRVAELKGMQQFVQRKRPSRVLATAKHSYIVQRKTRENMRQMGIIGALARAQKLSKRARKQIAKRAARARWRGIKSGAKASQGKPHGPSPSRRLPAGTSTAQAAERPRPTQQPQTPLEHRV